MGHSHDLAGEVPGALDQRLWASLLLNLGITLAEAAGGFLSGSLALLSDSAHNLGDVAAVGLALAARRIGNLPPTNRYTYGFKRMEIVAAVLNASLLLALALLIAWQAALRLGNPEPPARGIMLAVGLAALAANLGSVLLLKRHDPGDVNVRGAFIHMLQDALSSLAVVAAALLSHTPAGPWLDPLAALAISLLMVWGGMGLLRRTFSTLLEGVPADLDAAALAEQASRDLPSVRLHHVHLWENGPGQRLLTAHVAVEPGMEAPAIGRLSSDLKAYLRGRWDIRHSILEPELEACENTGLLGRWKGRGESAAPRAEEGRRASRGRDSISIAAANGHARCLICGELNPRSLKLSFQAGEDGSVWADFRGSGELQGYEDILHGGVISSLLDAAMTHCLFHRKVKAVTGDLHVRFVHPVPCGAPLQLKAWITSFGPPLYGLKAELSAEHRVMAWAEATFARPQAP